MAELVRSTGGVPDPQDEDRIGLDAVADQIGADDRQFAIASTDEPTAIRVLCEIFGRGDQLQGEALRPEG